MPSTAASLPTGATRKTTQAPPRARRAGEPAEPFAYLLAERERDGERVQVDADRGAAELGVVAAAEPGGQLHHDAGRPRRAGPACTSGRSRIPSASAAARAASTRRSVVDAGRPDVRERDAEGGRLGR